MSRALRTAVVVTGDVQPAASLDALLVDTRDYDVIFVESIARSYSRIKQVIPDMVIVCSEIDDAAACQLLSMLKVDSRASRVPVLTCVTCGEHDDFDHDFAELDRGTPAQPLPIPMN